MTVEIGPENIISKEALHIVTAHDNANHKDVMIYTGIALIHFKGGTPSSATRREPVTWIIPQPHSSSHEEWDHVQAVTGNVSLAAIGYSPWQYVHGENIYNAIWAVDTVKISWETMGGSKQRIRVTCDVVVTGRESYVYRVAYNIVVKGRK